MDLDRLVRSAEGILMGVSFYLWFLLHSLMIATTVDQEYSGYLLQNLLSPWAKGFIVFDLSVSFLGLIFVNPAANANTPREWVKAKLGTIFSWSWHGWCLISWCAIAICFITTPWSIAWGVPAIFYLGGRFGIHCVMTEQERITHER